MYSELVRDLENKLTGKEWSLVYSYIHKADEYGKAGKDSAARESLLDAIAVSRANGNDSAAGKIQYYLRFY